MNMKRKLTWILLLPLLLTISSCIDNEPQTFNINYDYGNISKRIDEETGKEVPIVTYLYDDGLFSTSINIDLDSKYKFLVPGDTLKIRYTGELSKQETYPSTINISGEITTIYYEYTRIINISSAYINRDENNKIVSIVDYYYPDPYIVINENLDFIPLSEYDGENIFGSYDSSLNYNCPRNALCEVQRFPLGALFAFNPRITNN